MWDAAIRLERLEDGEPPDHRFDEDDDVELRLDVGPGEGVMRTTSARDEGPVGTSFL
jgi:putative component of toxin-antitoxin plasmid stabilization module